MSCASTSSICSGSRRIGKTEGLPCINHVGTTRTVGTTGSSGVERVFVNVVSLSRNSERLRGGLTLGRGSYFIPRMRPSFERRPDRLSGMPVALEIFRLALVTPSARFHEKVSPGPSFIMSSQLFGSFFQNMSTPNTCASGATAHHECEKDSENKHESDWEDDHPNDNCDKPTQLAHINLLISNRQLTIRVCRRMHDMVS